LLSLFGYFRPADREKAFQALERVGIVEKGYVRASQLSGGQQQRVAIARVLAQDPTVILADEPVASLDPPTAHMVMRDLERINDELGITTIVNLHFLDLARRYADRIIGMRDGRIVFDGPPADANDAVFEQIYGRSLTAEDVLSAAEEAAEGEAAEQAARGARAESQDGAEESSTAAPT
jgi:phosphonate transport system ATP-binding protein